MCVCVYWWWWWWWWEKEEEEDEEYGREVRRRKGRGLQGAMSNKPRQDPVEKWKTAKRRAGDYSAVAIPRS